jgi:cytoskeletal protein CcmA (bactofilin family)
MFGKKKDLTIEMTKLSSLIASNMEVNGDIQYVEGLRVDGHIRGNVRAKDSAKSLIVLSDQGSVTGNVSAYDAVINGTIRGDLEVTHFLELQASAHVIGNITYHQLRMDCGASVEGKLTKVGHAGEDTNVVDIGMTAVAGSK